MYKIAFFCREDDYEQLPVKMSCCKIDTNKQIQEKAFIALMDLLEDEGSAIEYNLVEIKDLV